MSQHENGSMNTRTLIGLAVAAGTAAASAMALTRRRAAPPPPISAQALLADQRLQAVLADPRVQAAADAARASLEQARQRATSPEAQALKHEVLERVGQAVDTARSELPPLARQAADVAAVVADRLLADGAVLSADLGERLKSEVAPAARELAQEAIAEAEEILTGARERAAEIGTKSPADLVPNLGPRTAALSGAAAGVAASLGESVGKAVGGTLSSRRPTRSAPGAGARLAGATGNAVQTAAEQLKHVAGETVMIGFWAGALSGVVYYGLLRPGQRERVRNALLGAYGQARSLIQGFSAHDEDYAPGRD